METLSRQQLERLWEIPSPIGSDNIKSIRSSRINEKLEIVLEGATVRLGQHQITYGNSPLRETLCIIENPNEGITTICYRLGQSIYHQQFATTDISLSPKFNVKLRP